jgi:hypothetical protein
MKVIFLDIDGVLNSCDNWVHPDDRGEEPTSLLWSLHDLDPGHIEVLNTIIGATNAKVVISSSWRMAHPIDDLIDMLTTQGLKGDVISITPILYRNLVPTMDGPMPSGDPKDRGDEVEMWLKHWPDEVENFVILDDIDFDGFVQFGEKFIHIQDYTGLLKKHADQAIAILNAE